MKTLLRRLLRLPPVDVAAEIQDGPPAPQNVRVELDDGQVIPCELAYEGVAEGVHRWVATAPVALRGRGWTLHIDALPAHTSVGVSFT